MINLSVACLATLRVNRVLLSENLRHVASLRHKKVKVFTDNENASRIVSVGSPKQHLQCLVPDILQLCLVNDIQIEAQWIPRDANVRADLLSRFVDKDDWSLNCEFLPSWIPDGARILSIDLPLITSRFNSRFLTVAGLLCSGWLVSGLA